MLDHAEYRSDVLLDVLSGDSYWWKHLCQQHLRRCGRGSGRLNLRLDAEQVQGLPLLHQLQHHDRPGHVTLLHDAGGFLLVPLLLAVRIWCCKHVKHDIRDD